MKKCFRFTSVSELVIIFYKIIIYVSLFFVLFISHAQGPFQLSLNAGPCIPIGRFKTVVGIGGGFNLSLHYRFSDSGLSLGVKSGYNIFGSRNLIVNDQPVRYSLFPILLSSKYHLNKKTFQPFIALDAGPIIFRERKAIGTTNRIKNNLVNFIVSPSFGLDYNSSKRIAFSINGAYNIMLSSLSPTNNRILNFANIYLGITYRF